MVLTGSIVNFLGILLGGGVGLLIHRLMKKGIPERFSDIIMKGIGLCVLAIAFDGILAGENPMITIFATVIGCPRQRLSLCKGIHDRHPALLRRHHGHQGFP